MKHFDCPYLRGRVELTDERELHITERHPELAGRVEILADVLANPDSVRLSPRFADARLFSLWLAELRGGKHLVVVVASESKRDRRWIMTAYVTRKLTGGNIEWARS
jgi:hypothetical protein